MEGVRGPVGGVGDDSHPTCNTVLHQLVMGQPSHMPKADDMLIKGDLKDLQQSGKTKSEASMGAFSPTLPRATCCLTHTSTPAVHANTKWACDDSHALQHKRRRCKQFNVPQGRGDATTSSGSCRASPRAAIVVRFHLKCINHIVPSCWRCIRQSVITPSTQSTEMTETRNLALARFVIKHRGITWRCLSMLRQ